MNRFVRVSCVSVAGALVLTSCGVGQQEAVVVKKDQGVVDSGVSYSPGTTSGEVLSPADPRIASGVGYAEFNASQERALKSVVESCMSDAGFAVSPEIGQSDPNPRRDELADYFGTRAAEAEYRGSFGYGVTWSLSSVEAFTAEERLNTEYNKAEAAVLAGLSSAQKAERDRVVERCDSLAYDSVISKELTEWDRRFAELPAAEDSDAARTGAEAWAQCLSAAIEPNFTGKDIKASSKGSPESLLTKMSRPLYEKDVSVVGSQEALDLIALEKQWAEADWSCREKHYNAPLVDTRRAIHKKFLEDNAELHNKLTQTLSSQQ